MRAIIVHKDNLLVMERNKFGQHYYTLIGGHIELGESQGKALLREIHEETMVETRNPRLVYIEHAEAPYGIQYVYLCEYVGGVPLLHPKSDERAINTGGNNLYTPRWLPLGELANVPFRSKQLQQRLLDHIKNGFPDEIEEFTSNLS